MSYSNKYRVFQGELIIYEDKTDNVLWKGKPLDVDVEKVSRIPDSEDMIVLLNWIKAESQHKKNLIRITPLGDIVWQVERPSIKQQGPSRDDIRGEVYTDITNIESDCVTAYAYSGYSDFIDIRNGKIIKSVFVK
jgi:hypothetical protein